jgi:hypothetical protein
VQLCLESAHLVVESGNLRIALCEPYPQRLIRREVGSAYPALAPVGETYVHLIACALERLDAIAAPECRDALTARVRGAAHADHQLLDHVERLGMQHRGNREP